ncbi:PQQ-dependent sugar dehydrogenase [Flavilitoribacter nigricans]|uniref:PKD domain-containing protein n=1 Tax=Flavilitoribacter nigricans (strain ATCC 23147 / DSM 23189 / NBRC 102662 / NCIMB 1420 / SS-2) TaxID=1122177 RepID=A0A2D0N2G7_FLAN2|nr:PQQ-dependent sugar dehydrogenase [Flavilitoribacter nigricans]PHN02586.1 PKD domain-containing protein [Flavilitoribacter nigricans DSM 23189 = NBRC 102662]
MITKRSEFFHLGGIGSLAFALVVVLLQWSCQGTKEPMDHNLPPEENRFTTTVISEPGALDEPMAFTFLNDEEMLIVERKGGVKSFNVVGREMKTVGNVPVNTKYTNKEGQTREAEEGLMGVVAHPDFAENNWVFMLYADPDEPKHVLARWEYRDGSLQDATKKIVLEYPAQREVCCHTGGGMVFDKNGNLYLTTGNNTANPPSGTSNLDERPGFENADDQRTAGNTNDLRGKILRIHPEDDGTYTIPEGNLFAEGTPKTRAEIYTMGHRNPWRVSIDSETGYIYWGEVGPDASEDTERGPRGYDEFNQAKGPGFFGWPYFIGDNIPYTDYDFTTDSVGPAFDVAQPINDSPNNTGMTELPTPTKAFIWYPYTYSEEFPKMGSAGRSATGGPVFREADFPASDKRFPAYYEGKWLMVEFMRGWIMAVSMDDKGDYVSMEPFLPKENFSSAIDMQFSPDGDLYVLEYGSAWFRGNENAQVKQIRYNGGNRVPVVVAGADKMAGALPLTVQLSSEGTVDYDKDDLDYEWTVKSDNGFSETLNKPNPSLTLDKEGLYTVRLKVTDPDGESNEQTFEIVAGNAPPEVDIVIEQGNKTFFFPGNSLNYAINVQDQEDGSLASGIQSDEVAVNFDYAPEGFDPIEIAQNHRSTDEWVTFSRGKTLISESDCLSCHRVDVKSIGPSYLEVAAKYKGDAQAQSLIADRIINGSVGIWGEHAMSAHPDLSKSDAESIVHYIMGLNDAEGAAASIPLSGTYVTKVPAGENGKGGYLLRAAYTDKGNGNLRPLTTEKIIALRNPVINVESYDEAEGTHLMTTPGRSFNIIKDNAFLAFKDLDLSGISEVVINAEAASRVDAAGGIIEMHLDSPDGTLVGSTEKIVPVEIDFRAELQKLRDEWEKNGKKGPQPNFRTVREMFRPTYTIAVDGVEGMHDVYFVIRNPEAKDGQILIGMEQLEFKQAGSGADMTQ